MLKRNNNANKLDSSAVTRANTIFSIAFSKKVLQRMNIMMTTEKDHQPDFPWHIRAPQHFIMFSKETSYNVILYSVKIRLSDFP